MPPGCTKRVRPLARRRGRHDAIALPEHFGLSVEGLCRSLVDDARTDGEAACLGMGIAHPVRLRRKYRSPRDALSTRGNLLRPDSKGRITFCTTGSRSRRMTSSHSILLPRLRRIEVASRPRIKTAPSIAVHGTKPPPGASGEPAHRIARVVAHFPFLDLDHVEIRAPSRDAELYARAIRQRAPTSSRSATLAYSVGRGVLTLGIVKRQRRTARLPIARRFSSPDPPR